jgi:amino acid adenylation domain-containing protein
MNNNVRLSNVDPADIHLDDLPRFLLPSTPHGSDYHAVAILLDPALPLTRLEDTLRGLLAQTPLCGDLTTWQIWQEQVSARRFDERAEAWRIRELRRPIDVRSGPGLRAVVASYTDGQELILVAHRALLDTSSLRTLAAALTCGRVAHLAARRPALTVDRELDEEVRSAFRPLTLDWCAPEALPSRNNAAADFPLGHLPAGNGNAKVLAAVALTLTRYEGIEEVVLGSIAPTNMGDQLGVAEGLSLIPVSIDDDRKVAEFVSEVGTALNVRTSRSQHDLVRDLAGEDGQIPTIAVQTDLTRWPGAGETQYEPGRLRAFPITLHIGRRQDRPEDLVARLRYDADRFDSTMLRRFVESVGNVIREISDSPIKTVGELRLLTAGQEAELLQLGDGGTLPTPSILTIHEAVKAQAVTQPNAPAVSFGDEVLTYRELDELSDRVHGYLRTRGIGVGAKVGVCLPRSAQLIAVLLGVLKAGSSYVPMDPDYPVKRLLYTVSDAGLSAVITTDSFPAISNLDLLRPDELFTTAPPPDLVNVAGPDDPAYVIYTSGSTGKPKGVVIPHRNVACLIEATRSDFELGPEDVWTQFHSIAFDFSVWEIWGCLMTGGRLVVVPYLVARSPDEFYELLLRDRVTVLNQTPTAFGHLLSTGQHPERLAVRLMIFGGETLDTRLLKAWFDSVPVSACRVVNMFGITETTVHVTVENLDRGAALRKSRMVGKPLSGWRQTVRDLVGRVLPVGVKGEIWVAGAGVARGYHNQTELTRERFVTDPVDGVRWYRSGDLGRLLSDGRLEHLGRIDDQVSVRGHRVELGEITSVLREDPAITAAAVIVGHARDHSDGDGDGDGDGARLHAFIVASEGTDPLAVRRRAAQILPSFMLPATISCVPRLPLTANGKLDVEALRALPTASPPVPRPQKASDVTIHRICEVWSVLLGTEVATADDFFELGGNSLLATKLVLALKDEGLPTLPIRQLYRRPTPAGVAAYYNDLAANSQPD